ncbi:hypothetical protein [uncultured Alteromonas sp.]|uniref:hypothetical protein n=1 Tax=uncultured Alteromonas sp. TaxID=179113 RepID=UPI0030CD8617|tara:strand:- start:17264 stop:17896 length:633 start_codon:yes stop_codon:yes gene_type:complete
MTDKDQIFNGMKDEFSSIRSEERAEYLLEKIAEMFMVSKSQSAYIAKLEKAVYESELFFNLPEVTLITRSKLPRVVIDANDVVPVGDNFYEAESYGGGGYYRWTGPERLNNFHVPIDRTEEKTLRISIVNAIKPEILNSIKLYVDGDLISYDFEKRNEGIEIVASLPVSSRVQDTLISLFIPHLFSPSEVKPESSDNRKLGIAFHQLEVL